MKALSIALLAVSFSAVAANPELDAVIKKYESSLLNIQVGMSSVANNESLDLTMDERGNVTAAKLGRREHKSVVINVDGSKAYEYELKKDLETNEITTTVYLNSYAYEYGSDANDSLKNIRVSQDQLLVDVSGDSDGFKYKGAMSKNLLEPMFCGLKSVVTGTIKSADGGIVYPMLDKQDVKCGPTVSLEEIKKLDLTKVEFCDNTLPSDSDETFCGVRDMSFLTSDL